MTKRNSSAACGAAWWPALALATTLAACGGGGNEAETTSATGSTPTEEAARRRFRRPAPAPVPVPAPTPAPTPAPDPAPAPSGQISETCGLANFEAEALQRINVYRASGASCGSYGSFAAAPSLAWNSALITAAGRHSHDMATRNFMSHTGSDSSNGGSRAADAGYNWRSWGENIAAGYPSVRLVVDAWMASPGHCANIMKPIFRDAGLACVKGTASNEYPTYWTMVLSQPAP